MNSIAIGFIVFACCFGAALFGMFLSTRLPEQHLSAGRQGEVLAFGFHHGYRALWKNLLRFWQLWLR